MFVIGIAIALLLVGIGLLLRCKKAYWLIAGYNTMSSEQQENVDVDGLAKFIGNTLFVWAGVFALGFGLMGLGKSWGGYVLILIPALVIHMIIVAQKYDGNTRDAQGKMTAKAKRQVGIIVALLVVVSLGVGILLFYSSLPAGYSLENGILSISGMYGEDVDIAGVTSLQLLESMPKVLFKSNGSGLGNMLKGTFNLEGMGKVKVFVDVDNPPYIFLKTVAGPYLFNGATEDETRSLYNDLLSEWGGD